MKLERNSQRLFGIVVVMMIASCLSATGWAKTKAGEGKLRSGTGILTEIKQNVLLLEVGKKKSLAIQMVKGTKVYAEVISNPKQLEVGAVVEVSGQGKGNELLASKMIVLPKNEKMKLQKKPKAGNAYPLEMKKTSIKGTVITCDPLVIKNRSHQMIKVAFAKKYSLRVRRQADQSKVIANRKVKIKYRESQKALVAETIIVFSEQKPDSRKK